MGTYTCPPPPPPPPRLTAWHCRCAGSRRSLYHLIHKNVFIKIFAPYIVWICYIYFVLEMPFLVRGDGVFPGLVALPYCTSFQRDKSQCNLWLSLPGNVGVLSVKIISICLKCCGQIPCHLELLGLKSVISTGFVRVFKDLNFRSSISRPCFEVLIFVFVVVFLFLKVLKCFTADHTTFLKDRRQMQTIEKFVYSFPVLPYYSMVHWAIRTPGISITRICFHN